MHRMDNFKINDALQAKMINTVKTAEQKLLNTNAMI